MYRYEKKESKIKKFFFILIYTVIIVSISIYLYDFYQKINVEKKMEEDFNAVILSTEQQEEKSETAITDIAKCVVGISKIKDVGESIFMSSAIEELGLGTGMLISNNGYILTNWHVAGNKYSSCYVTLENGETYKGSTVWADSDLDVAIVKIDSTGFNYLNLGDSDNIYLGETVYAIGNPIGMEFQRTVTSGIISGLNRTVKLEEDGKLSYMEGLIQTDASINPGNSGGPLINKNGEVIGINTIKIEETEGIGFAIPINVIKPVIESFVNTGKFEEAYLGIFAYDKQVIPYLDSEIDFKNGIYVVQIMDDGAAAKVDIKIGDIITAIDGNTVNRMGELRNYIYKKSPGDVVELSINRSGREYKVNIKLNKKYKEIYKNDKITHNQTKTDKICNKKVDKY